MPDALYGYLPRHPDRAPRVNLTCQPCQPCQPNFFGATATELARSELPAAILYRQRDPSPTAESNYPMSPPNDGGGDPLRLMVWLIAARQL